MKNARYLFIRVVDDENNKVKDWIDKHIEILLSLFFTENRKVLNEIFEKLL